MNAQECRIINQFHEIYYNRLSGERPIYENTFWMGFPCLKCPLDLWIYQEIIFQIKPTIIIETGTYHGGSALYIAHLLDILDTGSIITIDIETYADRPQHPRIKYLTGSSTDEILVRKALTGYDLAKCLVILDSDHSKDHVLKELKLLSSYVSLDSYLIVEDTNINGHPTFPTFGAGPFEAVQEFLWADNRFIADVSREKFLMTFNPKGYLKRIA